MTHEARILVMAVMAVCPAVLFAMPTRQELKKAQPLVAELMAPTIDDFKAKKKTAVDVADAAVKYAGEAETEAAKFMLYRSSIPYYVKGEAYDKAADAVEQMKANVKGVPPSVVEEIISKATVRATAKKAPRLFELYRQAKAQSVAEKDIAAFRAKLKKNPDSQPNTRNLAEALATFGDWDAALKEFAKLKDKTAQMAKGEQDGSAKSASLGEFWWSYKPTYENAEDTFEMHAAVHYRKALAADEISGLKKNIVEQRIAKYGAMTVVVSGNGTGVTPRIPAANGLYCVIDLSGGPDVKKYPVTYVDEEPSGGWTLEEKTKKLVLRKVKAGGDPLGRYTISRDYYIGVFEVSQEQWERVMGVNPSESKCEHYPVTMISTADVRGVQGGNKMGKDGFAAALSERTGVGDFDLPTEAQWDYANRVGVVCKLDDRIWERCLDNGSSLLGSDPLGDTSGRAVANCKWKKNEQKVVYAGTNFTNPCGDRGFRIILNLN